MNRLKTRRFALGIGKPVDRKRLSDKFKLLGWELISVISKQSIIGNYNVGLNIMHNAYISNDVKIGEQSREFVNKYHNLEILTKRLIKIYNELHSIN